MNVGDAILARLDQVLAEQRALRRLIESQLPNVRKVDPARDAALLSAIAGSLGGQTFSVPRLLQLRQADAPLRSVLEETSPRQLGTWLRRLNGKSIGGYVLERVARDNQGTLWALRVCAASTYIPSSSQTPARRLER